MNTPDDTIKDREPRYGSFTERAHMLRQFKHIAENTPSYVNMTAAQQEGLLSIFGKISRLLNGDGGDKDSWHDIAGYALLVEDSIKHANPAEEAWLRELQARHGAGVVGGMDLCIECGGDCNDCARDGSKNPIIDAEHWARPDR